MNKSTNESDSRDSFIINMNRWDRHKKLPVEIFERISSIANGIFIRYTTKGNSSKVEPDHNARVDEAVDAIHAAGINGSVIGEIELNFLVANLLAEFQSEQKMGDETEEAIKVIISANKNISMAVMKIKQLMANKDIAQAREVWIKIMFIAQTIEFDMKKDYPEINQHSILRLIQEMFELQI
jgi:hypothetical protein